MSVAVSIIVPVYNVESYIHQALTSLCGQTLKDIEILVVDDCGRDRSMSIVRDFAARDTRIRIIVNPCNLGIGASRQKALDLASGDWVGFVDPDDWVDADFFERLYDEAVRAGADIARGGHVLCDEGGAPKKRRLPTADRRGGVYAYAYASAIWESIYRRAFLTDYHIRFPALNCGEDEVFVTQAAVKCARLAVCPDVFYFYRVRSGSATRSAYLDRMVANTEARKRIADFLGGAGLELADYLPLFHEKVLKSGFSQIQRDYAAYRRTGDPADARDANDRLRSCLRILRASVNDAPLRHEIMVRYESLFLCRLMAGQWDDLLRFFSRPRVRRSLLWRIFLPRWRRNIREEALVISGLRLYARRARRGRDVRSVLGVPVRTSAFIDGPGL